MGNQLIQVIEIFVDIHSNKYLLSLLAPLFDLGNKIKEELFVGAAI